MTRSNEPASSTPGYFIMMEDIDYPLRVKRQGLTVACAELGLSFRHLGATVGGEGGPSAPWRLYYQTRNHLRMAIDNRSVTLVVGWLYRQLGGLLALDACSLTGEASACATGGAARSTPCAIGWARWSCRLRDGAAATNLTLRQVSPYTDDARNEEVRRRPPVQLPKIISVDDHVIEPPHVWQDRLP